MIAENLEIGNWVKTRQNSSKLSRDPSKLSHLVCSYVHTVDTDETRQSCPCRRCEQALMDTYIQTHRQTDKDTHTHTHTDVVFNVLLGRELGSADELGDGNILYGLCSNSRPPHEPES